MQLIIDPGTWFKELFIEAGISNSLSIFLSTVALTAIVIILSWLSNVFAKVVIMGIVTRIVKRTTSTWDDIFLEKKEIQSVINNEPDTPFPNSERITNLGIFRFYAESHLRKHNQIDENQTVILRHRTTEGNGLPLQVVVFSKKTDMVSYENLQSEIFEHLLAVLHEFELKVFQQPTGDDFLSLLIKTK